MHAVNIKFSTFLKKFYSYFPEIYQTEAFSAPTWESNLDNPCSKYVSVLAYVEREKVVSFELWNSLLTHLVFFFFFLGGVGGRMNTFSI